MRLYRGTQLAKQKGRQKVTSWTTSLPVAVIYSARPGDVWGGTPPRFLSTSTVHVGEMSDDAKLLVLCDGNNACSFGQVMEELDYDKPDGLTYAEARKILQYMHNRLIGRTTGGSFSYVVFDDEGEPMDEHEVPFSLRDPETLISYAFIEEWEYEPEKIGPLLWADAFVFADSATFRNVARRLGYDAVIYMDVFQGGEFAAPPLLGCDVYELDGVDEVFEIYEDETLPAHETVRPLHKDTIKDTETVPTETLLPEVSCKAANPGLKRKLLR
jgi:hypothetical protein